MRSTFQNSGTALSIGVSFSLMVSGLAATLPNALRTGLQAQGVPEPVAADAATLPPVSTLFATFLGRNPLGHLLPSGDIRFFPELISAPFHAGLVTVFTAAAAMAGVAALASALRGRRIH